MKRLSIAVFLVLLSASMLVGGVFLTRDSGISSLAALNSQVQDVEGVNYNNFNNPRMLTADKNYVYVLDRTDLKFNEDTSLYEEVYFNIVVIDRLNGRTVNPTPIRLQHSGTPRFIKLESDGTKSYVFIFYVSGFMVFNAADLAAGKYDPLKLGGDSLVAYKKSLSGSPDQSPFFNVHYRGATGFMVIWGRANTYRYTYYRIPSTGTSIQTDTTEISTTERTLDITNETAIDGIVHDGTTSDGFYISYSDSNKFARFYYHRSTALMQLSPELFSNVLSINYIASENKLVFLNFSGGRKITWLHVSTGDSGFVELRSGNNLDPWTTNNPIYLSAISANEIFVIDGNEQRGSKKIDQYHFDIETGNIKLFQIIASTWGDSKGFYYNPNTMAVIGPGQFIVADRSGQIALTDLSSGEIPQPFTRESTASVVTSMVYDNFKHVYTFDAAHGIRKFDLNGALVKSFSEDSTGRSFGNITQLIAAPDQTIFALDSGTNRIYRLNDGIAFEEIMRARTFTIVSETRGSIHDSENLLVLTSASFSGTRQTAAINLSSASFAVSSVDVTKLDASSSNGELVLDIVFDVVGNAITLVRIPNIADEEFPYKYELRKFILDKTDSVPAFILDDEFDGKTNKTMQVYAQNAGLCLDKLNSRLYYIGAHHAIEYIDLRAELWTFNDWQYSSSRWTSSPRTKFDRAANKTPWLFKDPSGQTSNFAVAKRDIPIYDYPSALFANLPTASKIQVAKGGVMKVLEATATFDKGKESEQMFDYRYVMFEAHNNVYYGYVRINDIDVSHPSENPSFVAGNIYNSGRTIYDRTRIYQFPTADNSVLLGRIARNYNGLDENTGKPGLPVRFVTVRDQRGRAYYEIRISPTMEAGVQCLDPEGGFPLYHPDPIGDFVGYVSSSSIIDYDLPPSKEFFVSNAKISNRSGSVQVYIFDGLNYTPIENEFLADGTQIHVRNTAQLNAQYTYVTYYIAYSNGSGVELPGYIESRHVSMNGVTLIQILALTGIIVAVGVVVILVIWRMRREQRTKFKL